MLVYQRVPGSLLAVGPTFMGRLEVSWTPLLAAFQDSALVAAAIGLGSKCCASCQAKPTMYAM